MSEKPVQDDPQSQKTVTLPESATSNIAGLIAMSVCILVMLKLQYIYESDGKTQWPIWQVTLTHMLIVFGATALYEVIALKVFKRSSTELDWSQRWRPSFKRVGLKVIGLLVTLGVFGFFYWQFPEYHKDYYSYFFTAMKSLLPYIIIGGGIYFFILDGYMKNPIDNYYNIGALVFGRWKDVDWSSIGGHFRGWLVKAFFIPLMFTWYCTNIAELPNVAITADIIPSIQNLYTYILVMIVMVDLLIGLCGYVFAFRILDSHERSSNPLMLGWVFALMCYPPINKGTSGVYLPYGSEQNWQKIFAGDPLMLKIWMCIVIVFWILYAWATVAFGYRFSNLTHRGIVTSGPYRYMKHPAYVSKNTSWWLTALPFIYAGDWELKLRFSIALILVNVVYAMRALTEELHLEEDPKYRAYQAWIEEHGIFRAIKPRTWWKRLVAYGRSSSASSDRIQSSLVP